MKKMVLVALCALPVVQPVNCMEQSNEWKKLGFVAVATGVTITAGHILYNKIFKKKKEKKTLFDANTFVSKREFDEHKVKYEASSAALINLQTNSLTLKNQFERHLNQMLACFKSIELNENQNSDQATPVCQRSPSSSPRYELPRYEKDFPASADSFTSLRKEFTEFVSMNDIMTQWCKKNNICDNPLDPAVLYRNNILLEESSTIEELMNSLGKSVDTDENKPIDQAQLERIVTVFHKKMIEMNCKIAFINFALRYLDLGLITLDREGSVSLSKLDGVRNFQNSDESSESDDIGQEGEFVGSFVDVSK